MRILPLNCANIVARLAEMDCVCVNVVGYARGPVVLVFCNRMTPMVAAVCGPLHLFFAAVLLHLLSKIGTTA